MIVEYTSSFDKNFSKLSLEIQQSSKEVIHVFLSAYANKQFPKGLRVHKCGPFLSLSITMNYRVFVYPILGGIRFVFVGNHHDADQYIKKH